MQDSNSKGGSMDKKNLMKLIIGGVVLVGVLFLYWKFDFSKNASQISTLKGEFDNVNTQVNEARKVAARMAEYIDRIKVLEGQLKIANRMLPDSQLLASVPHRARAVERMLDLDRPLELRAGDPQRLGEPAGATDRARYIR